MAFIFVFLDGVGLGKEDDSNPFNTCSTPFLTRVLDGNKFTQIAMDKEYKNATLLGLDACLDVSGIPQSATGQTSLFTGLNASKLLGRHLNAYPNEPLRKVLATKGIFSQLMENKISCSFANAYRPERLVELSTHINKDCSCSTLITYYAGLNFRSLEDLREGNAVYMDITNEYLIKWGYDTKLITPEEAAKSLLKVSKCFSFVLYESFITDIIGHKGSEHEAKAVLDRIDAFIGSIIDNMNQEEDLLLVTSDHGNLENICERNHTKNLVPALIVGKNREKLVNLLMAKKDITGVVPAILDYMRA